MTRSARAASRSTALSTALATGLALAVGWSALATDAWPRPKVPLPKPRPIARNVVPKTTVRRKDRRQGRRATPTASAPPRRRRSSPRRASMRAPAAAARKPPSRRRGGRHVIDLAGRRRGAGKRHRARAQAQAGRRDPGRSGDIGSGGAEARRMDHPAQRRQRRVGRALSRLHRRQSELAFADLPAPAPRGGAVGRPSRRRHGTGRGSKTNRRCRPRASSRWRAR